MPFTGPAISATKRTINSENREIRLPREIRFCLYLTGVPKKKEKSVIPKPNNDNKESPPYTIERAIL